MKFNSVGHTASQTQMYDVLHLQNSDLPKQHVKPFVEGFWTGYDPISLSYPLMLIHSRAEVTCERGQQSHSEMCRLGDFLFHLQPLKTMPCLETYGMLMQTPQKQKQNQ